MSAQPKKVGEEIRSLMGSLQRSKAAPLRLFKSDEDAATGRKVRVVYRIVTLEPDTRAGTELWEKLHNDDNITIITEKDYMSHRDGLKTVIRYAETVEEHDPDELAEELMS